MDSLKKAPPERALKAATVYHMSGATQAERSHNGYRRKSLVTDTGESRSKLGVIAKPALSAADHQAPMTFPAIGARAPSARAPAAQTFSSSSCGGAGSAIVANIGAQACGRHDQPRERLPAVRRRGERESCRRARNGQSGRAMTFGSSALTGRRNAAPLEKGDVCRDRLPRSVLPEVRTLREWAPVDPIERRH